MALYSKTANSTSFAHAKQVRSQDVTLTQRTHNNAYILNSDYRRSPIPLSGTPWPVFCQQRSILVNDSQEAHGPLSGPKHPFENLDKPSDRRGGRLYPRSGCQGVGRRKGIRLGV